MNGGSASPRLRAKYWLAAPVLPVSLFSQPSRDCDLGPVLARGALLALAVGVERAAQVAFADARRGDLAPGPIRDRRLAQAGGALPGLRAPRSRDPGGTGRCRCRSMPAAETSRSAVAAAREYRVSACSGSLSLHQVVGLRERGDGRRPIERRRRGRVEAGRQVGARPRTRARLVALSMARHSTGSGATGVGRLGDRLRIGRLQSATGSQPDVATASREGLGRVQPGVEGAGERPDQPAERAVVRRRAPPGRSSRAAPAAPGPPAPRARSAWPRRRPLPRLPAATVASESGSARTTTLGLRQEAQSQLDVGGLESGPAVGILGEQPRLRVRPERPSAASSSRRRPRPGPASGGPGRAAAPRGRCPAARAPPRPRRRPRRCRPCRPARPCRRDVCAAAATSTAEPAGALLAVGRVGVGRQPHHDDHSASSSASPSSSAVLGGSSVITSSSPKSGRLEFGADRVGVADRDDREPVGMDVVLGRLPARRRSSPPRPPRGSEPVRRPASPWTKSPPRAPTTAPGRLEAQREDADQVVARGRQLRRRSPRVSRMRRSSDSDSDDGRNGGRASGRPSERRTGPAPRRMSKPAPTP